ncbi:MAG: hypothetical protein ACHQU1_02970 [Gemmatimonadales bacterium]
MTAQAAGTLPLRVTVGDTWLPLPVDAAPNETVGQVKLRALATCGIDKASAGEYEVKMGGALLPDERRTLEALGVKPGTALIVLARRRRPVR